MVLGTRRKKGEATSCFGTLLGRELERISYVRGGRQAPEVLRVLGTHQDLLEKGYPGTMFLASSLGEGYSGIKEHLATTHL